jgi:hypothetical protein
MLIFNFNFITANHADTHSSSQTLTRSNNMKVNITISLMGTNFLNRFYFVKVTQRYHSEKAPTEWVWVGMVGEFRVSRDRRN